MARDLPSERPGYVPTRRKPKPKLLPKPKRAPEPAQRDAPMDATTRRAVARVIRQDRAEGTAKRAAEAKRERERKQLIAKVRSGKYLTPADRKRMVTAGFDVAGYRTLPGKVFMNVLEAGVYTPAGAYELGKAATLDARDTIVKRQPTLKRTGKVGKAVVASTKDTIRHPLRRPGDTLLLGLAAVTGGATAASRLSAAGTAARVAATTGKGSALKAALTRPGFEGGSLLRKPAPEKRYLRVGDTVVRSRYSASPAVRSVQKAKDRATNQMGGFTEAGAVRRTASEIGQNRKVVDAAERAPSLALAKAGKKATGPQQMALRVWAEGTSIDTKIAKHRADLAKAKTQQQRNDLRYRISLLEAARPYITESAEVKPVRAGQGDSLAPGRTLKRKEGAPGISREDGYDTVAKRSDPDNPIYVYRGDDGKPLGTLQVTLEGGKPARFNVTVHPGARRQGIASKLFDAADRDWDISPALSDDLYTPEGAAFVNAYASKRSRVRLASDFKPPRRIRSGGARGLNASQLRAITHRIDKVAGDQPGGRERVLRDMGLLDDEQIEFRKHAPGRMELGAEFVSTAKATSERLKEINRTRREMLEGVEDVQVPGRTVEVRTPRTREDAIARVGEIDEALAPLLGEWNRNLKDLIDAHKVKGGGAAKSRYEHQSDKLGWRKVMEGVSNEDLDVAGLLQDAPQGRKLRTRPKVDDMAYEVLSQLAGRSKQYDVFDLETMLAIHKQLEAEGVDFAQLRGVLDERDTLAGAIADDPSLSPDAVFGEGAQGVADFGADVTLEELPGYTMPGRLSDEDAGLLAALDELEADLTRQGLRGAEDFQGGRVRIPDVPNVRQPRPMRPQQYRGGVPRKPASVTQGYTGALRRTGNYRVKTTGLVAESGLEAQRYASVSRLRDTVLKAARDTRPEDTRRLTWVPVREKSSLSPKVRQKLRDVGERVEVDVPMTLEEKRVASAAWQEYVDDIFPQNELKTVGVGEKVPGVKWIPKQALDGINRPIATGVWGQSLALYDTVMNLVKFGVIPLKPAYIVANAGGNALFNLVQQGVMLPANWKRATSMLRDPDLGPAMRELMGSGAAHAVLEGNTRGPLANLMTRTSDAMAEVMLEPMMRLSSLVHEGRRFGVRSKDEWRDLIQNPGRRDDLAEINRRAKDAIIDYDRLGPIEKGVVRRFVFIYPWVKGATMYAGHFLMEHPVQAGVYSQVANVGREQAQQDIGDVPSWARGIFKVGGTDDFPLTVNPSGISPFSQAAQIGYTGLGALTGEGGSAEQVGGMLHPALRSVLEGAFQRDLSTGAPKQGSFLDIAKDSILSDIAPVVYREQLEKASDGRQDSRAYPITQTQAHMRFGLGSWAPRTANREVLNERAGDERERNIKPDVRARRDVFAERNAVFAKIKAEAPNVLENGRLPAGIRQAYNREAAVKAARAIAKREFGSGAGYQRAALIAEAKLAESWGAVDKGFARQAETWAAGQDAKALEDARERLRYQALRPAYGDVTSRARKFLADE